VTLQPASDAVVRFDAYELDLRTGELRRNGVSLGLQPQPAKVLAALASAAGEVVSRQELAERVWGTETFVDFEQGLNFAIRQIRHALEDDADHPRFVETLPKRGYRFIAPVQHVPQLPGPVPGAGIEASKSQLSSAGLRTWRKAWRVAAAAGAVVLVAVLVAYLRSPRGSSVAAIGPIQSVAVLPFANLSSDPLQEYFSEGLTDEVITELARIGDLRVISRTSVMGYKGTRKRMPEIGQELRVEAIVEGTVERVGDRVRIRAQLIRTATDEHLWAASYDRDVNDLLQLEADVASDVARQIGRVSVNPQKRKRPVAVGAHEDYLRGRYHWNKRTEAGLRKGIEYFQKAIEQDPNYALPYSGLADSYIMLANWNFAPPGEAYPRAKAAAQKALELDEELAEAHTSLAYVTLLYDWDWQGADQRFRKAIALNPNYATAHHFYSICLMSAGRHAEAQAEIQRALELDPLSLIINSVHGWIYYEGRKYQQAIQQYNKTLEMDSAYVPTLMLLGTGYMRVGDYPKAIVQFEKARAVGGENGSVLSGLAQAHALSGKRAEARRILRRLEHPTSATFVSPWDMALLYAALGDKAKAVQSLERAADQHVGWVVRLGVEPAFDSLRDEPQFEQLRRRIGVPQA
jgi:TolB-like protein/DNA-binding winged helix-turn-helix (wHTH) protein/Tfp pilus assembly protein PilF